MRKSARIAVATGTAALAITIAACGSAARPAAHTAAARPATTTQPAAPAQTPTPAIPDPAGTYQFSGDYTLGNPTGDTWGDNFLVGEVDLTNTGNVGTVDRITFGWPQEGSSAITMTKTIRVPYASSRVARFRYDAGSVANSNIIDLLQGWQSGHGEADGYTAHVTIVRTFGPAH